jgi:uncharacterized protein
MVNIFRSRPFTSRKCVGVVGLLQAGKTVLIPSLIDHLKNHDPSRFPIGKIGTEVTPCNSKLPPSTRWEEFDFDLHKDRLARHEWPPKTLQPKEFRSLIYRSDWQRTLVDLSLLDIPGERMADMVIATFPMYSDWSDSILKVLRANSEYSRAAQFFFKAIDAPEPADSLELRLLKAYRRTLAVGRLPGCHLARSPTRFA